jgi:anti-anti-sigma factor
MALAGAPEISGGEHACCVFASDDAQADLVAKFARDAVKRHDRIFYLADRSDETKVADYLADALLDGTAMLDSGALQVMHSSQMDLEDGFDRNRQLAAWRQLTAAARDDGYRGLAVAAEMSWALSRNVGLDALIEYEATSQPVFVSGELAALCEYDSRMFDAETLWRTEHAHSYSIEVDGEVLSIDYNRLRLRTGHPLELGGEIDLSNVRFLEHQLVELLADGDVVADCSGLTFVDARGCRLIHRACNGEHGRGRLVLTGRSDVVERVMRVFDALDD